MINTNDPTFQVMLFCKLYSWAPAALSMPLQSQRSNLSLAVVSCRSGFELLVPWICKLFLRELIQLLECIEAVPVNKRSNL